MMTGSCNVPWESSGARGSMDAATQGSLSIRAVPSLTGSLGT